MPTQAQAVYQPADPLIQCAPQQLPTLLNLPPPQQLLLYPRLQNPPMSLAQNVAQPRFLLPNPQLTSFPQVNGMKRSHDQAFMAGTSGAGVPPKRPPVM